MTSQETVDAIRYHAEAILDLLPPPAAAAITTPEALDAALAAATPGQVLTLDPTLVYPQRLALHQHVTLQSTTFQAHKGTRMTRNEPAPTFLDGVEVWANQAALLGLAFQGTDTIAALVGAETVWDRCRLLGSPTSGAHRGFAWYGGKQSIRRCYVDDIFRPDQDTQALCGWDCDPGLVLEDNYLCAAGQAVMFGGADASSEAKMPRAIAMSKNTHTKQPSWIGVYQCKCAVEFKCVIDVNISGDSFAYGGTNQGQGCYLILATVRNQDGRAPWSCIHNVEISYCTGDHASGVANILGRDNVNPSGQLIGFNLHDCEFTGLDGHLGAGRVFLFGDGPDRVTLQRLRISGTHIASLGYFYDAPPTGLVMTDLTELPPSEFGWYVDGRGSGRNVLLAYAPDAVLDETIV